MFSPVLDDVIGVLAILYLAMIGHLVFVAAHIIGDRWVNYQVNRTFPRWRYWQGITVRLEK